MDAVGKVPSFVNLAGRYTKPGCNHSATFSESQWRQLEETGAVHLTTRGSRKFVVTREDIEERSKQDMRNVSLITSAILTVHGDQDKIVSVDNAFQFDSAIKNHRICIIQGADHNFSGSLSMEKLKVVVCNFIREQMEKQSNRCLK
jgi:esterase/lipase